MTRLIEAIRRLTRWHVVGGYDESAAFVTRDIVHYDNGCPAPGPMEGKGK